MQHYRVDFESIPWNAPAAGFRFKIHKQDGKQLRIVEFSKEFVEPDWCTRGHIGCVLEGEFEINFSGKLMTFKAGDGLFIRAGEQNKHMARAVTDVATLFLVEDI